MWNATKQNNRQNTKENNQWRHSATRKQDKMVMALYINNYLKYKWTEFTNKKAQGSSLD